MRALRSPVLVLVLWMALGLKPAWAAPDEYDDSQSHPLRIAAYLIHPAAWLVEWTVFRPFHLLVSGAKPLEAVFGHTPHPPVVTGPQTDSSYGVRYMGSTKAPQADPRAQERIVETVKVVEVPVEKIVYKEVPKMVDVERVVFPDIAFRFDSAELTDLGKGKVYLAAQKLKEKSDVTVVIEGHADETGSDEYNHKLGLRRAQKVVSELAALGIDPGRITAVSQGESKPLVNQSSDWARAVNRRVEMQVKAQ